MNARLHLGSLGIVVAVLLAPSSSGCSSAEDPAPGGADDFSVDKRVRQPSGRAATPTADSGANEGGDPSAPDPESGDQPGTLSKAYRHFDINHVIVTQPSSDVKFDTGVDYEVETPSSGLGNEVSNLAKLRYGFGRDGMPAREDVLVTVNGRSGNPLWCIRKSGCTDKDHAMVRPFDQAMNDVESAKQIAAASNLSYVVRGVSIIHGENDHYGYAYGTPEFPRNGSDGTPNKLKDYADGLIELQEDYETSIQALSGQTQPVPLFVSQLSGWTDAPGSRIAVIEYDAHVRAAGKVVLVTPGYPMSVQSDCLHYNADGHRRLAEYFAKAYARVVFENKPWEPVRPKQISHADNVITVKYYVPKLPLAIDTTRVSDPGNYGFGVFDDGGAQITMVELAGPDTVRITLSKTPSANARLRYALNSGRPSGSRRAPRGLNQPTGGCIGPGTSYGGGARGNLRDSDDAPSQYGYDLQNWGVQFDLPVP